MQGRKGSHISFLSLIRSEKMKKVLFYLLVGLLMCPNIINAATSSSNVGYDLTRYQCTSKYQDRNISTSGEAYFSHCVKYYNRGNGCTLEYYSDEKVNCLNGNNNPYYETYKNGCSNYNNKSCDSVSYCSIIIKYDCSRKGDGSSFATTTKSTTTTTKKRTTTKRTTVKTTTQTTTTTKIISTKLKSLTLDKGSIVFDPNTYEYNITLNNEDNSVNVTAIAEDSSCSVNVENNTNLVNGSVILVNVGHSSGVKSVYKINVTKNVVLSSNNNLKSLSIKEYPISFNKDIKEYEVSVDEDTTSLTIDYELEDDKASISITGNENLKTGSKVTVTVTSEDNNPNVYYLNVTVNKKSNTILIVFIVIIALAVIAGGYYLFKKFVLDKAGDKYEYE